MTVCAERTAVFRAVSEGATSFRAVVVTTDTKESFVYPCGTFYLLFMEIIRKNKGKNDLE